MKITHALQQVLNIAVDTESCVMFTLRDKIIARRLCEQQVWIAKEDGSLVTNMQVREVNIEAISITSTPLAMRKLYDAVQGVGQPFVLIHASGVKAFVGAFANHEGLKERPICFLAQLPALVTKG